MMKTKFSLLIFALLFVCSGMMAQDKITIGVIQYDLGDVDKSFKDLHDLVLVNLIIRKTSLQKILLKK